MRPISQAAVSTRTGTYKQMVNTESKIHQLEKPTRPAPTVTLSTLRLETDQATGQGGEDGLSAWRIHKQEKRFMLCNAQSPTRTRRKKFQYKDRGGKKQTRDNICRRVVKRDHYKRKRPEQWRMRRK